MFRLLSFSLYIACVLCNTLRNNDVQDLTNIFLVNLKENSISAGDEFTDQIKQDIDSQVRNFVNLIRGEDNGGSLYRKRRGLDSHGGLRKDLHGVQKLRDFKSILSFNARSPQDVILFQHKNDLTENWYAAVIENDSDIISMHLVIYKFDGGSKFSEIHRRKICYAHKLSTFTMHDFTIILVAECCPVVDIASIYQFDYDEHFTKIQNLNMSNARDVAFWENQNEIYMAIAHHLTEEKDIPNYQVETPIYKWMGTYFDVVNTVMTYGASTLTGFTIGNSMFLAVANRLNNNGETNIYSEIFNYNRHLERFSSYQKLLTYGAIDIKYFCFQQHNKKESYLIVTDSFTAKDSDDDVVVELNSIIYKYLDGFFVPFQNIRINNLIEWQAFVGPYGKFALIAVCKNKGIKTYQYDGWKFVPVQIETMPEKLNSNVIALHPQIFMEEPVIVTASKLSVDIFQLNYEEDQEFNDFYDEMLDWCKNETKNLEIYKKSSVNLTEVKTKREIQEFKQINENLDEEDSIELQNLRNILESREQFLESQQKEINIQLPVYSDINIIEGDLVANNIIINNEAFLNHLTAESINHVDVVDLLNNIININDGFVVGETFHLDNITVLNEISPQIINNKLSSHILTRRNDIILSDLIVKGNITFKSNIKVNGKINDVNIVKNEILLMDEDQIFDSDLNIGSLTANKVTSKFLNKLEISQFNLFNNKPVIVNRTNNLKADSIFVEGFVNLIDISTINKFALRKSGDQNITAEYIFDKLVTSDLDVSDSLSNVEVPKNLIRIDKGIYNITQDVQFTENVTMNNLILTERFNHINVKNHRLDILLKDSSNVQQISGLKTILEVDLKHPVNLQGKLNISGMEDMNPLTILDDDIVLNGDFILSGNVTIEEAIFAQDIFSEDAQFSVSKLRQQGLKLEDDTVESFVEFIQPLAVNNVHATAINGIDIDSFIVKNTNNSQYINAVKEIDGDLYMDGTVQLHFVNGVDFNELIFNTLMVNGDQTVAGTVILDEIDVDSVTSLNANIGQRDWNTLLTSNDESVSGITEVRVPINVKSLNADFVDIHGKINGINFDAMIEDTVFPDQSIYELKGQKTVQNLIADSITIRNNQFDMESPIKLLVQSEIIFYTEEIIRLPNDLIVENLVFKNILNNVTANNFNSGLFKSGPNVTFTEDQYFNNVIVLKQVLVASDRISHLNLTDFNENALRHTENHIFSMATFEDELVSPGLVTLDGHIENLDLENVLLTSEVPQNLFDKTVFLEDVFINGELNIKGSINSNMVLQDICDFVSSTDVDNERHMIINGSAIFARGPEVDVLNGFKPKQLLESSWMPHEHIKISKNAVFDNVVFKKNLNLDGFLDQVNVEWLAKNYLSKSKDQNITAHYFIAGVNFAKGMSTPIAKVRGTLFGVHLLEFMRTALLDNLDQVFEEPLFLEQAIFKNLEGEYLVNNMNLENDVMRYDAENVVTGLKSIADLEIHQLQINDGTKIQNVDVQRWIQNTAMKTENFQMKGRMIVNNNVTFESGVGLEGLLNHNVFNEDTIMLRSKSQNITGIKTFKEHPIFALIITNDFVNGVNITELFDNQVYKNENVFITSQVDIGSPMVTNRLEFNSLWNGVNFSKMIDTMKTSNDIEYQHEKFDNLLMITNDIQKSFEHRAYFLDDYKLEGTFENTLDVIPIKFFDGNHRLAILRKLNQTNIVSFFIQDAEINQFVIDISSLQIIFNQDVTYMNVVDFYSNSYLYMETELTNHTQKTTHEGNLIRVSNQSSFEIIHKINNNGTKFVHSFILPDQKQNCLAFLYNNENCVDIFCEIDGVLQILEKLDVDNAFQITSSIIDGITFIYLINGATERGDACLQVWKFDQHTRLFNIHQVIHTVRPNSLSVVTFNEVGYLAISSERIEETVYSGQVEIRRYDPSTQHFPPHYQTLSDQINEQSSVHLPVQVQFAVLPSSELVLYVRTADTVRPLLVYRYRGVERFVWQITATSVLAPADSMRPYTDRANNHFVVWKHRPDAEDERDADVSLVKAVMHGDKQFNYN